MNCHESIQRTKRAVKAYRDSAHEPMTMNQWIARFGAVYTVHFAREFCLCKDGMVRARRLSSFGKWADSIA